MTANVFGKKPGGKEYVNFEPYKAEYVLAGTKCRMVTDGRNKSPMAFGETGYLLGKNGKPTRDMSDAMVFELDDYREVYQYENRGEVYVSGMCLRLMKKTRAEQFLLSHPLPRKKVPNETRESVYALFDGRCAYCGRPITIKEMQVDHIVSHMHNGGADSEDNYYPACPICNRVKSSFTLEGFRSNIRNCARIHHGRKPRDRHIYADSDKIAEYYGLLGDDWKEKPITFHFEKEQPK